MKLNFDRAFRGYLVVMALTLGWSFWASAQPANARAATNSPTGLSTNSLTARLTGHLDEDYVSFGLNRFEFLRDHTIFGEPLWKYLASLIFVFLAFYISKFTDYLTRVWLKVLTQKTETKLDDLLLDVLNGPIKVVVFVIFLNIGMGIFRWPPVVAAALAKGMIIILACSLTYMVLKIIDLLLGVWRRRAARPEDEQFHKQLFPIIRRTLKVFTIIVALLVTAQNLGINITGLLASLSIGGLAVGLAAQDTLANMFGAVAVLLDKPFRVGDRIQLDSVDGVVEAIGFRSTRVRNLDGHLVTIPNKTIGGATITNITERSSIRTVMNLGITYDAGSDRIQKAIEILNDIFRNHPNTREVSVGFNKFADSALNIQVVHWWNNADGQAQLAGLQELNLAIKRRFDEAGIKFAFPSQTIYVKQDSEWQLGKESFPASASN